MAFTTDWSSGVLKIFGTGTTFPPYSPPDQTKLYRDDGKTFIYETSTNQWRELPAIDIPAFNVQSWGAKFDGKADDTVAIQAALDYVDSLGGGTVYFPKGSAKITSTLLVGRSGTFKTLNLVGLGMLNTKIQWFGATDQPAIRINGLKQYSIEGIFVENKVSKGTTVGVLVQRDTGIGSQSGSATWRNFRVDSFATGIQLGNVSITQATSEIHFDHLQLNTNDIGVLIPDGNSLDFVFTMLEMAGNGTGIKLTQGGEVQVHGAGVGGQTVADFDLAPGGASCLIGVRSEHSDRFLIGAGSTAGSAYTVMGCNVTAINNADGYGIVLGSGPITLIGNDLACKVKFTNTSACSHVVIGNAIADTQPFLPQGSGGHYVQIGNRQIDTSNLNVGHFSDEVGYISSSVRVPSWSIATTGEFGVGDGTTDVKWRKALVALGGGAAPTLGTIGGSGPQTAGQNSWLKVLDSTGAACWLPVWK